MLELHLFASNENFKNILIAELAAIGFVSFWEKSTELFAYIPSEDYSSDAVEALREAYPQAFPNGIHVYDTSEKSLAAKQEEDFTSVVISGKCLVRHPSVVPSKAYPYEILVDPQQAFGSGQHISTALCLEMQLELDFEQKNVLDLGCGSGILAVFAEKLGAASLLAVDNNPWAIQVCKQTLQQNTSQRIQVREGNFNILYAEEKFDIILANINAGVLLEQVQEYPRFLKDEGHLLLAGFLQKDAANVLKIAVDAGLIPVKRLEREDWVVLLLQA